MEQETEISNSETSNLEEIDIDNMTLKQLKEYAQKVIEKRKKDKQKNKEIIRELIRKEISSSSSESGSDENPKFKPKIKGIVKPLEFETPSHKSRRIEEEFYETPFKSRSSLASHMLPTTITSSFNVDEEVAALVGSTEDREKRKDKGAKEGKLEDVPIYTKSMQFVDWWRQFCFAVSTKGQQRNYSQVKYYFINYMDQTIKQSIKLLSPLAQSSLEDLVRLVLTYYEIKPKNVDDFQQELFSLKKQTGESVATYYMRFVRLAADAKITDESILIRRYLSGLRPMALNKSVLDSIDPNRDSLNKIQEVALLKESNYLTIQLLIDEEKAEKKENTTQNSQKQNPKFNKNNSTGDQKNSNKKNQNFKKNSENTGTTSKKETSKICKYCDKEHDFKDCLKKYQNYTFAEAKLLQKVGREPLPRANKVEAKDRLTENTEWIKKLLDQKNDSNKTSNDQKK